MLFSGELMNTIQQMKRLIGVAMGQEEGDLILRNGIIFNTISGEVYTADVIICDDQIAGVGNYENASKIIDVKGKFIIPGLIDGHVHIESSMLSPGEFARALISHGVTTVIADPHELTNVCGRYGLDYFIAESARLPLNLYILVPSCVPATGLETSGAELKADDCRNYLDKPCVLGLAEMMNFPGVLSRDPEVLQKLQMFSGKVIDGHAPKLSGKELCAYIASGVASEHECVTAKEALEKLRLGMYIMIREGSATRNLLDLLPLVNKFNSPRCFLATDDLHPDDILYKGHIDHLVRMIISETGNAMRAVRMATCNAAEYYGLRNLGAIAPGKTADLAIISDLESFQVDTVIKSGKIVYEQSNYFWKRHDDEEYINSTYPGLTCTVKTGEINVSSFLIKSSGSHARVIEILPDQILTVAKTAEIPSVNGHAVSDTENDILKLCVIERHRASGAIGHGFVKGLGLKAGAFAASVSHDSHNIIVAGADDADMLSCCELIIKNNGGICVCHGDRKLILPLPLAGLMSLGSIDETAAALKDIRNMIRELGSSLSDPVMQLSFLALPVIPELKLTDRGLIDVSSQKIVPLWVD